MGEIIKNWRKLKEIRRNKRNAIIIFVNHNLGAKITIWLFDMSYKTNKIGKN